MRDTGITSKQILVTLVPIGFGLLLLLLRAPSSDLIIAELSNDAAMRLVQVRDLLAGQGWYDLMQYRMGPDGGFEMHWSRLIDAPIAALIMFFDLFTTTLWAEILTLYTWPTLVYMLIVWMIWQLSFALGGRRATLVALAITALNIGYNGKFGVGQLDHHNVQGMLMLLVLLAFVKRHNSPVWPVIAGAAAALSIGVGVENLPVLAWISFLLSLFWAFRGEPARAVVSGYAAGLIGALIFIFLISAPPSAYTGGYCDALSLDMAVPIVLAAAGLLLSARLVSDAKRAIRFGVLFILFGAGIAATYVLAPACFENPLDRLHPMVQQHWLNRVSEARSLLDLMKGEIDLFLGFLMPGLAGLICALALWRAQGRMIWLGWALVLAPTIIVLFYQVRGMSLTMLLGIVPVGVAVGALLDYSENHAKHWAAMLGMFVMMSSWLVFWIVLIALKDAVTGDLDDPDSIRRSSQNYGAECSSPDAIAQLAALPQGTILGTSNLGGHVLMLTDHSVISGNYHRNQAGLLAEISVKLAETDAEAEQVLRDTGTTYLVACPLGSGGSDAPLTFWGRVEAQQPPEFLELLPRDEGDILLIYRVVTAG